MPHGERIDPPGGELNGGLDRINQSEDTLLVNYDCQACGACCSHKWSWPVLRRDRADAELIPAVMLRSDYPLMKTIEGRCIALTGRVGESTGCSIYEARPSACRAFTPGSALCLEARHSAGLPAEYPQSGISKRTQGAVAETLLI